MITLFCVSLPVNAFSATNDNFHPEIQLNVVMHSPESYSSVYNV